MPQEGKSSSVLLGAWKVQSKYDKKITTQRLHNKPFVNHEAHVFTLAKHGFKDHGIIRVQHEVCFVAHANPETKEDRY